MIQFFPSLLKSTKIDLTQNLVSYWTMDGNGVDSVSGISPILETNVTYNNASILGTSAAVTADNAILRYADDDRFSFTDGTSDLPFSISCWVFFTAFSSTGNWLINKRGVPVSTTPTANEWQLLYFSNTNGFLLQKFQLNNASINQRIFSLGNVISLNTWYHLVVTDAGTADFNDMNMYLNGVNVTDIRENTGGTYTGMSNTASTMGMMGINWNPQSLSRHQGRLDEVAIWKGRELTPEEVLFLYNNGNGRTYIDL